MSTLEIRNEWTSIHWHYLDFAWRAYRDCLHPLEAEAPGLNKAALDTIRYSIDCLEASAEFVYNLFVLGQLPGQGIGAPPSKNQWKDLKTRERFDALARGWRGGDFYVGNEVGLLTDLKCVRNALTHPIPFGSTIEYRVLEREELEDGTVYTRRDLVSHVGNLGKKMYFQTPIALFSLNPFELGPEDAGRAIEILLRHIHRIEKTFFGRQTTWFALYDHATGQILSPGRLLATMQTKFDALWPL